MTMWRISSVHPFGERAYGSTKMKNYDNDLIYSKMEFKRKLGMHMTQAIAIYISGNRCIRHNPLCLVESTAYPVWLSQLHTQ